MVGDSVITEGMRRLIGVESRPYTFRVDKRAIRGFLDATGETNPLFRDEEWAKETRYGGTIAPPTFFCPDALVVAGQIIGLKLPLDPFPHVVDGGSEWECFQPVREGDILTLTVRVADVREKRGSARTGRMLLTTIEAICRNQREELVGIARGVRINYEGSRP